MTYQIIRDDLSGLEIQALIKEHLAGMHSTSPPESVHALGLEALRAPEVTLWSVWQGPVLCGCGALKDLGQAHGEVKSMRTRAAFLRQGVGQAVLTHLLDHAKAAGYSKLSLETGTTGAFKAAHQLYLRHGFTFCGPFGAYQQDGFSVFMTKLL
ncbi:MAG: hypothetical protein RLZZ401_649 [Pseudomonadota bacterium]|jgi:putative acetyltransferase